MPKNPMFARSLVDPRFNTSHHWHMLPAQNPQGQDWVSLSFANAMLCTETQVSWHPYGPLQPIRWHSHSLCILESQLRAANTLSSQRWLRHHRPICKHSWGSAGSRGSLPSQVGAVNFVLYEEATGGRIIRSTQVGSIGVVFQKSLRYTRIPDQHSPVIHLNLICA